MKRNIPLVFAFVAGMLVILAEFIPHRPFNQIVSTLEGWFMIISGFAILLGQISLIRMNSNKIRHKLPDWQYSLAGLISFALMLIVGLLWGMQETHGILGEGLGIQAALGAKPFDYLFTNALLPLSSTLFSLLAFFNRLCSIQSFYIPQL